MKKVLMITYFFPPVLTAGIHRILRFVKYLPDNGWQPYVLTIKDKHHQSVFFDWEKIQEIPEKVIVAKTGVFTVPFLLERTVSRLLNFLRRLYKMKHHLPRQESNRDTSGYQKNIQTFFHLLLEIPDRDIWWFPFCLPKAVWMCWKEKIDVIYTTGGPFATHVIGLVTKKITKKYWVADFRDPWAKSPIKNYPFPRLVKIINRCEQKVIEQANVVISNTPELTDQFRNSYAYLPREKFHTIPNGYDQQHFVGVEPIRFDKFTIVYAGSLYALHSPQSFFEALNDFSCSHPMVSKQIQVLFVGAEEKYYTNYLSNHNLDGMVRFIGPKSHKETIRYLISADLLLVILTSQERFSVFVPCKVYDYLGTGKPILSISSLGSLSDLIENLGVGTVVHPSDKVKIGKALEEYFVLWQRGTLQNRSIIDKEINNYEANHLTRQFTSLLEEI